MTIENKKKVIQIVKSTMQKINIQIDESEYYNPLGWENGYGVEYLENEKLIDGKQKNVYKVSFNGKDYEKYDENGELLHFMEGQKFTAYLDEEFNLLFILGNHGILEIK